MELNTYLKNILDNDNTIIIVCNLSHEIIYMNKTAKDTYTKRGMDLMGKNLLDCHNDDSKIKINNVINWFMKNKENNRIHTFFNEKQNKDVYMIAIRDENDNLIGYYEKHEYRNIDKTPFYDFR